MFPLQQNDQKFILEYKNGRQQKNENYFGNSFYSQSGRYVPVTGAAKSVIITNTVGEERKINF
ncbi:MAG: hypothetical protein HC867_04380 [Bacteroidia bacterium]|nr:hypothetical protein [Bacteroidia bacterium]